MLQQDTPEDYVISTGKQISVRDFVNITAKKLKLNLTWQGEGISECGISENKKIIKVDKRYFRPTEVDSLLGDSSKAIKKLNWQPKISLDKLINEMIFEEEKFINKK